MNVGDHSFDNCRRNSWMRRISLRDGLWLVLLLAIVIGTVAERVRTLPKEVSVRVPQFTSLKDVNAPRPPLSLEMEPLDWSRVLIGGIVIGCLAVVSSFVVARWHFRSLPFDLHSAWSRLAASCGCLVFVAALAFIHLEGYRYFEQQLLAGDWRYILGGSWINNIVDVHWGSTAIAAVVCLVAAIELLFRRLTFDRQSTTGTTQAV